MLLLSSQLYSQTPKVAVQTMLNPSTRPTYYTDLIEEKNMVTVQVQNLTNKTQFVRFRMVLDGQNGIQITLPESVEPSNPLKLGPMETRLLTQYDIEDMYGNISIDQLQIMGLKITDLIKGQRIADGFYNICVQAYDNNTLEALSANAPLGCSNKMIVTSVQAPRLEEPLLVSDTLEQSTPQFFTIRWTPVVAPGASIYYSLKIARVPKYTNPYDAMESEVLEVFEAPSTDNTFFNYGVQAPYLQPDQQYAIQVTAHDKNDATSISNGGKSNIISFYYKAAEVIEEVVLTPYACGEQCEDPSPSGAQRDIDDLSRHDRVKIGHFTMLIDDHTKSGNTYSGTGMIWPQEFFHAPIYVRFSNIQVNENKEVYAGSAIAEQKQEYLEMECVNNVGELFGMNEVDNAQEAFEMLCDPASLITNDVEEIMSPYEGMGVHLPLAFGHNQHKVIIVKMEFAPNGATMDLIHGHAIQGDYIDQAKYLIFGADNVCVTPGGVAMGQVNTRLGLLHDISYRPSSRYNMHFHKANEARTEGTFVEIDCNGVQRIDIAGLAALTREVVLPLDAQGNVIPNKLFCGKYQTTMERYDNMVFELDFSGSTDVEDMVITNRFQIVGLEDFDITVSHAYIDNSLNNNPLNMNFPLNYRNNDAVSWEGIYIKNFSLQLPEYMQKENTPVLSIIGTDLLVDDHGLTGEVAVNNFITDRDKGKLANWDFTMDTLFMTFMRNDLRSAGFRGMMAMEFCEDPFAYEAEIMIENDETKFDFTLTSNNKLSVPMWGAKMNLNESSKLHLNVTNGNPVLSAELHGTLDLDDKIGPVEGIEITGLEFENVIVTSESPYIEGGNFSPQGQLSQKIGGFKVGLERIRIEQGRSNGIPTTDLKFDLDFGFGEDENAMSGKSRMAIQAKRNANTGDWDFEDIKIEGIRLRAKTSSVQISGRLTWFHNDNVYGNGFSGALDTAIFMEKFDVSAEATFGTRGSYDYWSVSAASSIYPPAPLVGVFALNAFGGGAYYNMEPVSMNPNVDISSLTPRYSPKRGSWGLSSMVGITTTDGYFMNGKVSFEAAFHRASLQRVNLNGDVYVLQSGGPSQKMIHLNGNLEYVHTTQVLDATLGYNIQIPPQYPLVVGEGGRQPKINLHFAGLKDWNIELGRPNDMMKLNMGFDAALFGRLGFDVNTYFDLGFDLPNPPSMPQHVEDELGPMNFTLASRSTAGVMAGFHASYHLPRKTAFKIWGNGVKLEASAGMGIDMAFRHMPSISCRGRSSFGINKWYASARGYMWGDMKLKGEIAYHDFDIAEVGFYTALMTELPNPTYMKGRLSAHVKLPVFGTYHVKKGFRVGEKCEQEVDDNFVETLALEDLVDRVYFEHDVDSINAYSPQSKIFFDMVVPVANEQTFDLTKDDKLYTKLSYNITVLEGDAGNKRRIFEQEGHLDGKVQRRDKLFVRATNYNNRISILLKDGRVDPFLKPGKHYKVILNAVIKYKINNGQWQTLRDSAGTPTHDRRYIEFVCSKRDVGQLDQVVAAVPGVGERYFHKGDVENNQGMLQWEDDRFVDKWGRGSARFYVRYLDTKTGATKGVTANYVGTGELVDYTQITYPLPTLTKNRIYKVEILIAREATGSDGFEPIFSYYFKTSYYNTLQEKINDLEMEVERMNPGMELSYYKLTFRGRERFSRTEGVPELSYIHNKNIMDQSFTPWHNRYSRTKQYAQRRGISEEYLFPEFVFNSNEVRLEGKLEGIRLERAIYLQNLSSSYLPPEVRDVFVYTWYPDLHLSSLRNRIIQNARPLDRPHRYVGQTYLPFEETGKIVFELQHTNGVSTRKSKVFVSTPIKGGK
jgi:uncharacterized membrane protein